MMTKAASGTENAAEIAPTSFLSRHWQKLIALALWLLMAGLFIWFLRSNGYSLTEGVFTLLAGIAGSVWGPLLFMLIYALRPLTFFSAALLTIAAGFLFGPFWGWFYATIGANAGALLAFAIGRYFGSGVLEENESAGMVQTYARRMREESFITIMIMRLIFLPYDLVNYLAGFLRIDWRAFLLASLIGSFPGSIAFVLLGAAASPEAIESLFRTGEIPALDWRVLALSVIMFVASVGLSLYVKRREPNSAA
ncbi:MAG: TVP38/TMEM64 family protein [Caldilineaceae bacterium]|nr:TVP38/TMEM64 family protein [Caldilineaceae bacterium]